MAAPRLYEPAQRVVRRQLGVTGQQLVRDRAMRGCGSVHGVKEPALDALPVIGDTSYHSHRISHDLERDRADEVRWNLDLGCILNVHGDATLSVAEYARKPIRQVDRSFGFFSTTESQGLEDQYRYIYTYIYVYFGTNWSIE